MKFLKVLRFAVLVFPCVMAYADDLRPVIVIDERDVVFNVRNVEREFTVEDRSRVLDRVAKSLNDVNIFRVLTTKSVEQSIRDRELFNTLIGENEKISKLDFPSYRVKMSVLEYASNIKKHTTSRTKKHTFKKKSVWVSEITTRTTTVEIMFNVVDLSNGDLILSERFSYDKSESESENSFSNRKGSTLSKNGEVRSDDVSYQQAIQDIVTQFSERLKDIRPYHILGCTDDGVLTLDVTESIVSKGDLMDVFHLGKVYYSKNSGKRFRSEKKVAEVRVTNVSMNGCTAVFEEIMDADCDWNVILRRRKK